MSLKLADFSIKYRVQKVVLNLKIQGQFCRKEREREKENKSSKVRGKFQSLSSASAVRTDYTSTQRRAQKPINI